MWAFLVILNSLSYVKCVGKGKGRHIDMFTGRKLNTSNYGIYYKRIARQKVLKRRLKLHCRTKEQFSWPTKYPTHIITICNTPY